MPEQEPTTGNGSPESPRDAQVDAQLCERIRLLALRIASNRVSAADAADLAQDLLLELLIRRRNSLGKQDVDGELAPIVGQAVRFKIIDRYRAHARWDGHADEHETARAQTAQDARDPAAILELKELYELIGRVLNALSRERREVFLRVKMDGFTHKEVAAERGITVAAVEKSVMRTSHVLHAAFSSYPR